MRDMVITHLLNVCKVTVKKKDFMHLHIAKIKKDIPFRLSVSVTCVDLILMLIHASL